MILVLQMCKSVSETVGEYILGEIHYKYSNMTNRQKKKKQFSEFEGKRNFYESK